MLNQIGLLFGVWGDWARDSYLCWCCVKAVSYTRTSKSMTEEQVWLLICAAASMELSEFPPHGTALLDCPLRGSNTALYSVRH